MKERIYAYLTVIVMKAIRLIVSEESSLKTKRKKILNKKIEKKIQNFLQKFLEF